MKGAGPDGQDVEELRRRMRAPVSEDDVASEEYDDPGYFENVPGWIRQIKDRYRYIARQIGRARLPGPDHDDQDRIDRLWQIIEQADKVYRVFKYTEGMSDEQIAKEFVNYFSGLEKRVNRIYFERIGNARYVYCGISAKEFDSIANGRWRETRPNEARKWIDVSTNREIGFRYAVYNADRYGVGIMLEIDMDSIRGRLVSPGYTAKTVFDRPENDINEPDSLMRGMLNEEHHLPPDIDLRKAKIRITVIGYDSETKAEMEKNCQSINSNWEVV